jgi:hypothetical protein
MHSRTRRRQSHARFPYRRAPVGTDGVLPYGAVPTWAMIARRAYARWVVRGCPVGTAEQDWLEAETELKGELSRGQWG